MATSIDTISEYGSDFDDEDEAQLRQLLDNIEVNAELLLPNKPEDDERPVVARIPLGSQGSQPRSQVPIHSVATSETQLGSDPKITIATEDSPGTFDFETEEPSQNEAPDPRSPLERFRTQPKKPLSVTDMVSPAWCELQYWYSLTKYGRIKRTAAMKRGSEVHKVMEEQVHTTVPVETQTKEDRWGLRIWNVIQGLRTLRFTGVTRELELWGLLDGGEVINGIVDELTYTCTDKELEEKIEDASKAGKKEIELPNDQTTIGQFFKSQGATTIEERAPTLYESVGRPEFDANPSQTNYEQLNRKVYLVDVKTRTSNTLPNSTSMRPTHMQLMLYRKLLADMAANTVNADIVFQRYRVDPHRPFSDSLVAQLSSLEGNLDEQNDTEDDTTMASDEDIITELLSHNSLSQLWSLMILEFRRTIPKGAESISKVLKTEFRSSKDGSIVGVKTFPHIETQIDGYITEEMRWWRGEREARGVEVEEAFKCRICEFSEKCKWRADKIEDAVRNTRLRTAARKNETKVE